jgi:F0F1-type ATP synthase assembly protein I
VSAVPVLKKILRYGAILTGAILIVGSIVGFIVDGSRGLVSALIGALMAFVFLGITAASILLANRVSKNDFLNPAFFLIVLGGWVVKFAGFVVLILALRDQEWVNTVVLFIAVVVGVVGSLVVDVLVIARSRMPYVSDIQLPDDTATEKSA